MKILLITFDKEMEKKVKELLKGHEIITAKNGEEALLLNIANDVDIVIYDALAGGIAEDDINKLYEEGFQNVPFIILMDDLFPIDPANIKPKIKKIISREVDLDQLPKLVEELAKEAGKGEKVEAATAEAKAEEKPKEEKVEEELSWEKLMETTPAEEKKEEVSEERPPAIAETEVVPTLKKQCLLVSFDMPLVDRIKALIGDKCDLYVARSAKQALQKYAGKPFDIIIFDTISGVFAEKGIKDLYEKGGYKDSLYVLLLDEFLPLDVDKLPVKNLRAIKRESELDLLPEIVENAPHITFEILAKPTAEAVGGGETAPVETAVSTETFEETPHEVEEHKEEFAPAEHFEETTPHVHEEIAQSPVAEATPQPAPQPAPVQSAAPAGAVSEELIARIVEQKINEKIVPLVEELIKTKLSETYIKAIAREIIEPEIDEAMIKEIVRDIAEPLVKEVLDRLFT